MTTAKGQMQNFGMPFGMIQVGGKANPQMIRNYSGMLLGRIGTNGDLLLLGEQYDADPGAEGKLYLCIAPSHWGNPNCTGSYQVKISVRE